MKNNEKRIFITQCEPVCKHLKSTITTYHDGYVDEDEFCELTREKCKSENCKNKIFSGLTRQEAINTIAKIVRLSLEANHSYTKIAENILKYLLKINPRIK